ncbi:ATP-binding protein [Aminobacter ciceronei]|uniref:AAA+ ATPase domain-containing protein n=2 Tax=Aminobacter ciceronei TaxID=150723 RepID=A0ABR6CFH2_9HYPH|nr:ATP-binding protein [Aminobacter ciceronei]MBA8909892.1 hypothetical protein [Aminobacter ciceronei]MBA9023664.1 hypothetical protein [Aminobacter ciceronei]
MQTGTLQWDIDDLLVVAQDKAVARRLAVSCKGNVQVSANGLPASFADLAWRLWTKTDSPFDRSTDRLALATQGTHDDFQSAWSDIKKFAAGADAALALAQIEANPRYKRIFDSLKAAATAVTNADVLGLIGCLDVLPFDFQRLPSKDEADAIAVARSLLAGGTAQDATDLWGEIVGRAKETRLGSGTLDMAALRRWLRPRFALRDFPDYEPSWARLRALSAETESLVQTALPSGARLDFRSECDLLLTQLGEKPCVAVYGESGTGKSALVKAFLDTHFPSATRVWLAPEHLELALNEAERARFGLAHPLISVLDAAVTAENFLIIDSAERLSPASRLKAQQLVKQLLEVTGSEPPLAWRVILIGQTEFWASGELSKIAGTPSLARWEVRARSAGDVAAVLRASTGLEWLASHHDALMALTNLRTLAWVVQAAGVFQDDSGAAPTSMVAIAEKLWAHWTLGRTALEGFLIRLALRDAAFEHSVPVSTLEAADATAFDGRPPQCPVRRNPANNHVQFEHDLAADWARFQRLKEIASDTAQWAAYAENPLWNGALRMLGQLLLRQPSGSRTAWDDAFDQVQAAQGTLPLADDILLDALFLDPEAITFLEARADMLFANNAKHLQRLLARFEHVGSVSGVSLVNAGPLKDYGVYLEAKFRTPIVGRWPALAVFLGHHHQRVADLVLPRVSILCERWLTSMPLTLSDGTLVPYRQEFAELALATARARQLDVAKGVMYLGDDDSLFEAAFAGAQDLPDDVATWALEMAHRRPMRADLQAQLNQHHREKAAEHSRRMESDAEYRERHGRKRSISVMSSGRKLPPWPLGPQGRVDRAFEKAVRSRTFQSLMRARPAEAAEVLMAVLIEDSPEESYGSRGRYREELGLAYDNEGYPTAYWKSPFFSFLHVDPATAIDTLLRLLSFCMDRWEHDVTSHGGRSPAPIPVRLNDGTERQFRGRYNAFAWSQTSDHSNGQLYSSLAALEKWLCGLVDQGADVSSHINTLMRHADSVAILGVIINVGKRLPELFSAVLKPLLTVAPFYEWDERRIRDSEYSFDAMTWVRSGEMVFEMARDWYAAPYRHRKLTAIVSELCRKDHALGDFVNAAAAQWTPPDGDKERMEFQIRVAELDYRNYRAVGAGEEHQAEFVWPAELAAVISGFEQSRGRARQILAFPENCRRFLAAPAPLPVDQITAIADLMGAADGDEDVGLEEEMLRPARVTAAVVLLLGAKEWLASNESVHDRAQAIVHAAMEETALDKDRSRFHYSMTPSYLEFVAYLVFHEWLAAPSRDTDSALLRILTSGDDRAAGVIADMAYAHSAALGDRWWRLQYLALLWSGLIILKPRFGQEDGPDQSRWLRRARWLLTRRVSGVPCTVDDIRPLDVAKRIEEFEARQWEEEYRHDGRTFTRDRSRRMSGALETHFLQVAFAWLLIDKNLSAGVTELNQRRQLLNAFWAHTGWLLVGSESETSGDYAPMSQFGYKLLEAMAGMVLVTDAAESSLLWQPIFDIGPKGHYAIAHFFTCFFSHLEEDTDQALFAARWRPMIEAIMVGRGWEGGPWYHQQSLERHALGFARSDALARPSTSSRLIEPMRDLYRAWALKRLPNDEDNLAGLCGFLSTKAGQSLRLEGLVWIANSIQGASALARLAGQGPVADRPLYRDRTSAAFVEFLTTVITENGPTTVAQPETRQALIDLVGLAVSKQLSAALAIQDRLKSLL